MITNSIKNILIFFIKFYQKCISPYFISRCKYYPTCSQYMIDAINVFGPFKGFWLGVCRILRCHPFTKKCGYDPIPEKKMEPK